MSDDPANPGGAPRADGADGVSPPQPGLDLPPQPTAFDVPPPADDAAEGAGAYQSAQRASPWGFVFVLGLFGFLTGWAWYRVEEESGWVTQAWIFASAILTLAPLAWHSVDFFRSAMSRRGGAFLNVVLTITLGVVVMGVVSTLNVIRKDQLGSIDLTESGRYTLGDETKKILEKIPGTVFATYLSHSGPTARTSPELRDMAIEQLKVYGYHASDKVVVRVFDDFRESEAATRYLRSKGVVATSSGDSHDVIVLSYAEPGREVAAGKQKEIKVDEFDFAKASSADGSPRWLGERVVTGAIQELVFTRLKAYAVGGHGEHSLADDMREVRERLRSQNIEVVDRAHEFSGAPEIPDDCDLLLVLGPGSKFQPEEQAAIDRFLEKGKTLLLTLDVEETGTRRDTGLEEVLKKFGIEPRINYVVVAPFLRPMGGSAVAVEMRTQFVASGTDYASHAAVEPLRRGSGFGTIFLNSSFLEVDTETPAELNVEPVVWAPDKGIKDVPRPFAASVFPGRRDVGSPLKGRDKEGVRLPVVVVATRTLPADAAGTKRDARVIVSGDTDVFTDQAVQTSAPNLDLFGGLTQWGLRREELVAVSDKTLEQEFVKIGPRENRMAFWWPLVTALTALLAGSSVWWSRRR